MNSELYCLLLLGLSVSVLSADSLEAAAKTLVESEVHDIAEPNEASTKLHDLLYNATGEDNCVLILKDDPKLIGSGSALQLKDMNRTIVVLPLRANATHDDNLKFYPQMRDYLDEIKKPFHECIKSLEDIANVLGEIAKKTAEQFHFHAYFLAVWEGDGAVPFSAISRVEEAESFLAVSSTSNATLCSEPKETLPYEIITFISL
uniref:Nicastrin n=1 Tax=Steinernema glaseri TaxID=37863 RepID=A0A1I7YVP6_9BILA